MASSALNRHAEDVYASLSNEQQALAEMLFRALTERRESGGQEVRRPQSLAAVAAWAGVATDDLKPLIEAYAAPEVSFLHYGRELTGKSVVDLTHEALIRQWDRLRQWVASEFQRGQAYRRYSQRAAEYANDGDLLKGGELARALIGGIRARNAVFTPRSWRKTPFKPSPAGQIHRERIWSLVERP